MWHHLCKTMSMRILLLLFLSLSISGMSNTKIFGSAPNAINQYVYVSGIEDYLTNTESIIYTTSVNENGQFLIELNNSDIEEVVIRIKNSYAHLYVQNDTEYFIEFPEESIEIPLGPSKEAIPIFPSFEPGEVFLVIVVTFPTESILRILLFALSVT